MLKICVRKHKIFSSSTRNTGLIMGLLQPGINLQNGSNKRTTKQPIIKV